MPKPSDAHRAVERGAPSDLFAGLTATVHQVSPTAKFHDAGYCGRIPRRDKPPARAVPLTDLAPRRLCQECTSSGTIPVAVWPLLDAVNQILRIRQLTESLRATQTRGDTVPLTTTTELQAAVRTRLSHEVAAITLANSNATRAATAWAHATVTEAAAVLDACDNGVDPHQQALRAGVAIVVGELSGYVRSPDVGVLKSNPLQKAVDAAFSDGLCRRRDDEDIRAAVAATLANAEPTRMEQIPDTPAPPGMGARAGALYVWRTAAAQELDAAVTAALQRAAQVATDTSTSLMVIDGTTTPTSTRGLLVDPPVAQREEYTAYVVPTVIAAALTKTPGVYVRVVGSVPADMAPADLADVLLRLLTTTELDGVEALTAAIAVAAQPLTASAA